MLNRAHSYWDQSPFESHEGYKNKHDQSFFVNISDFSIKDNYIKSKPSSKRSSLLNHTENQKVTISDGSNLKQLKPEEILENHPRSLFRVQFKNW